ncbi:MAG TPA: hypothetical protein VJJ52_06195 [Candidatus Nanoarchaeia archaeon]|nr:hypothetical protein [Candidatus Nanoarchaeia archaeon]
MPSILNQLTKSCSIKETQREGVGTIMKRLRAGSNVPLMKI